MVHHVQRITFVVSCASIVTLAVLFVPLANTGFALAQEPAIPLPTSPAQLRGDLSSGEVADQQLRVLPETDITNFRVVMLSVPEQFSERLVSIDSITSVLGAETYSTVGDLLVAEEARPDVVVIDYTALQFLDSDNDTLARWYRDGTVIVGIQLTMDEMSAITRDNCMRKEFAIHSFFAQRPYYVYFKYAVLPMSGSDSLDQLATIHDSELAQCSEDTDVKSLTYSTSRGAGIRLLEGGWDLDVLPVTLAELSMDQREFARAGQRSSR